MKIESNRIDFKMCGLFEYYLCLKLCVFQLVCLCRISEIWNVLIIFQTWRIWKQKKITNNKNIRNTTHKEKNKFTGSKMRKKKPKRTNERTNNKQTHKSERIQSRDFIYFSACVSLKTWTNFNVYVIWSWCLCGRPWGFQKVFFSFCFYCFCIVFCILPRNQLSVVLFKLHCCIRICLTILNSQFSVSRSFFFRGVRKTKSSFSQTEPEPN